MTEILIAAGWVAMPRGMRATRAAFCACLMIADLFVFLTLRRFCGQPTAELQRI